LGFHVDPKVNARRWTGGALSSPLVKAASNEQGIEIFRTQLWRDAWNLFLDNPWIGIGFQKQVVYRLFVNQGMVSVPNDGKIATYGPAPISGPHNSYLNALARLGILGIGFLGLHIWALFLLWRSRLYFLFYCVFSGVVYSAFNVGLEGPVRSFILLIGLGAAALVSSHGSNHPPQPRITMTRETINSNDS
jgi:O-antigen ligase